jgi:hypothetical protein
VTGQLCLHVCLCSLWLCFPCLPLTATTHSTCCQGRMRMATLHGAGSPQSTQCSKHAHGMASYCTPVELRPSCVLPLHADAAARAQTLCCAAMRLLIVVGFQHTASQRCDLSCNTSGACLHTALQHTYP